MSGGHTPGPWATEYRATSRGGYAQEIFDSKGELIATAAWYPIKFSDTTTTTNREANAHLIAAAPQMAAVIADFLADVDCSDLDDLDYGRGLANSGMIERFRAALHRANPALSAGEKG